MKYLTFDTEQDALDVSAAEAVARGCKGSTTQWYAVRECSEGKWHLCCGDDTEVQGRETHEGEPVWPTEDT